MNRTLVIAICAIVVANSANANLIVNGGFEAPLVIGGNQGFTAPSSAITGWSVTSGSVELTMSGSILGNAHTGLQLLEVNGSNAGTIQQTFATTPGKSYLLELYYSNNPNPSFALPSYSASVTVSGSNTLFQQTLVHSGATESDMNWLLFSRAFVANSAATTLKFQSLQSGFNGVYFDSVVITPEPSSVILSVTAISGLLWPCRKKRYPNRVK